MDSKTIGIGLIIGLLLGAGVGYVIQQPKIDELTASVNQHQSTIVTLEAEVTGLQESLTASEGQVAQLTEDYQALEQEYTDYQAYYREMWTKYSDLLQDYASVPLMPPEGQLTYTLEPGFVNGDFSDYSDGVVGWVIQGESWHDEDGVYLHQWDTGSYMTQAVPIASKDTGLVFDLKPVTVDASITVQVSVGGVPIYQETFTGQGHDWQTVVVPLKYLLEMRDLYDLTSTGSNEVRFTVLPGPDNGAHVYFDNISLAEITYQPEEPY